MIRTLFVTAAVSALIPTCKSKGTAEVDASLPVPTATAIVSASPSASAPPKAGCQVVGSYHATVDTGHGPGTSATTIGADGSFTIAVTVAANHVTTTLKGNYTANENQITFVNTSGTAPNGAHINPCVGVKGVYAMTWTPDCKHLTLQKVSDSCPPREQEANGTTLQRD